MQGVEGIRPHIGGWDGAGRVREATTLGLEIRTGRSCDT